MPPAWPEQLAPDGRLVVPLRLRNLTRAVVFERNGHHLTGRGYGVCGFVPMQGAGQWRERLQPLAGEQVGLRFDRAVHIDVEPLRQALTQRGVEVWTGVTVGEQEPFDDLDLYLMNALPSFCMLAAQKPAVDSGLVNAPWMVATPAVVDGASFAYRMRPRPPTTPAPEAGRPGGGGVSRCLLRGRRVRPGQPIAGAGSFCRRRCVRRGPWRAPL
ncbi:hypothetical protein OG470_21580 [Micromonospora sp. NBC_00389]